MKRLLSAGIVLGVLLAFPAGVDAQKKQPKPKPVANSACEVVRLLQKAGVPIPKVVFTRVCGDLTKEK